MIANAGIQPAILQTDEMQCILVHAHVFKWSYYIVWVVWLLLHMPTGAEWKNKEKTHIFVYIPHEN